MASFVITTEHRNGYARGDVLAVVVDGHRFGRRETMTAWLASGGDPDDWRPNGLAVVHVPNEPPDLNFAEPALEDDPDDPGKTQALHKRAWRFTWADLPAAARRALAEPGGEATITRPQFRQALSHKVSRNGPPLRASADGRAWARHSDTNERARLDRDRPRPGRA